MIYNNLFFSRLSFLLHYGYEYDNAVLLLESYPQDFDSCIFEYMRYYDIKPYSREGSKLLKLLNSYEKENRHTYRSCPLCE